MSRLNVLYFSIALIIRERFYFALNILTGTCLIIYVSIYVEIAQMTDSIKGISIQIKSLNEIQFFVAIGLFGFFSGIRIVHSIAETGIMLAVGTKRIGVIALIVCKEFAYIVFSYLLFIMILSFFSIVSNVSFIELGFASLKALALAFTGSILISIPFSVYVTSIDPYDSIRRQK